MDIARQKANGTHRASGGYTSTPLVHSSKRLPRALVGLIVAVSALPFLLSLLGADFASSSSPLSLSEAPGYTKAEYVDALHESLSGGITHAILEWSAFCVAIFTAIMALLCYWIRRSDIATPIIGMALFCAGCMDAFHTLAATRLIEAAAENTDLIPFTWALCRLFNILILIIGVAVSLSRRFRNQTTSARFVLGSACAFAFLAYATIAICASSRNLPQTMFPDSWISRPYDVLPMVLFFIGGVTVFRSLYRREPSYFSHALLIAIVPNVATQLHMSFGSTALFDHHFNIAHGLKIVAYLVPLAGLCLHYISIQREANRLVHTLSTSEARTRTTIENAGDAFISIDGRGRIIEWNRQATSTFGWTRAEVMGKEVREVVVPPDQRDAHQLGLRNLQTGGPPRILNERIRVSAMRKSGEQFPVELTVYPVQSDDTITFSAFIRDLTSEVRAQEEKAAMQAELVHAQKLESIGLLAAGIAHEINTPAQYVGDNTRFLDESFQALVPLLEKADALVESVCAGAQSRELAEELKAAFEEADLEYLTEQTPRAIGQSLNGIERVRKIVQSMKEFSYPSGNEMTHIDLGHAIESTITVASNVWKYVAVVETDIDPELPPVPCLPGELNQVILNLIVNAAHAIADVPSSDPERRGTITISARRAGGFAEIRITDTGTGIPEHARGKIFDPFFTTKDVGQGTGQGLSIAHAVVVQKHGGTLDYETQMGEGSTFIILLPLEQKTLQPAEIHS